MSGKNRAHRDHLHTHVRGIPEPCAYDGCDEVGKVAYIEDRTGRRAVRVCDDHFGNWAARLANQGAEVRR